MPTMHFRKLSYGQYRPCNILEKTLTEMETKSQDQVCKKTEHRCTKTYDQKRNFMSSVSDLLVFAAFPAYGLSHGFSMQKKVKE